MNPVIGWSCDYCGKPGLKYSGVYIYCPHCGLSNGEKVNEILLESD